MALFIKRKIITSLVATCVILYLIFHAVSGEQGLYALLLGSYKVAMLEEELQEVSQKRMALEHKVALLRTENLDKDLLDEQARRYLGYVDPQEWVIIQTQ